MFTNLVGEDATNGSNKYEQTSGLAWGVFADLPLYAAADRRLRFFLRPELLFSRKGRETTNDGNKIALLELKYAGISLMGRVAYTLGSRWTLHALGGLEGSRLYDSLLRNYVSGGFTDQTDLLNRYDLGWNAGLGIQFATWNHQSVALEGFFRRGLLDIGEGVDIKNRALAVMLSYRIPLSSPSAPPPVFRVIAAAEHMGGSGSNDARDVATDGAGDRADPLSPKQAATDDDKDGLFGAEDMCPKAFGTKEQHGCPESDEDGDGLVDRLDKCRTEHGSITLRGCSDDDEVPGDEDICPSIRGKPELRGCNLIRLVDGTIDLSGKLRFRANNTKLVENSKEWLDEVADLMLDGRPALGPLTIEVTLVTRQKSPPRGLPQRAQARAAAVKSYLVDKGVPLERLEAKGTIATNARRQDKDRIVLVPTSSEPPPP